MNETTKPLFTVSTKAFIVHENKVLAIKRSDYTPERPGIWEFPGGRLDLGESPVDGLKRETKEEVGLEITVGEPLSVRHFKRIDGPWNYLIIFVCHPLSQNVTLSHEHDEYQWLDLADAKKTIAEFYFHDIDEYQKRFLKN